MMSMQLGVGNKHKNKIKSSGINDKMMPMKSKQKEKNYIKPKKPAIWKQN